MPIIENKSSALAETRDATAEKLLDGDSNIGLCVHFIGI